MTSLNKIDFQTITALALVALALPALIVAGLALRASDQARAISDGDYWAD